MSYKNGRLFECDRCGATHFCECNGEGERDGGYTRWNTFEPLPKEWGHTTDCKGLFHLCPVCNEEYKTVLKEFENGRTQNVCKNNN